MLELEQQSSATNLTKQLCSMHHQSNYFLSLRRQLRRDFRKSLIAMTAAKSKLSEFSIQARFSKIYDDFFPEQINQPNQIQRVILYSGQVYYDILKKREELKLKNTAIVRIEQLAPIPNEFLQTFIQKYNKAQFVWFQEDHQNYGLWSFVRPRILIQQQIEYMSRKTSGSPATGFHQIYQKECQVYLTKAFVF